MADHDFIPVIPQLPELWSHTMGDQRICIALLDGPVDLSHPSLQGACLSQVPPLPSLNPRTRKPTDNGPSEHGTMLASILFGQHGSGVSGVAPGCRGLILPVFEATASGGLENASQTDLAHAITRAVDEGANIINISSGQLTPSGQAEHFLSDAIRYCIDRQVLIVAAVGNDGCNCLHVPAAADSVLAVGACDADGKPLDFSNWDGSYGDHGVLCIGQDIRGALPGDQTGFRSGTSFATPIVSGVAALLLSLQLKQGDLPSPHGVAAAILHSAVPCDPNVVDDCQRSLAGSINISGAGEIVMNRLIVQPSRATTGITDRGSDRDPAFPRASSASTVGAIMAAGLNPDDPGAELEPSLQPATDDAVPETAAESTDGAVSPPQPPPAPSSVSQPVAQQAEHPSVNPSNQAQIPPAALTPAASPAQASDAVRPANCSCPPGQPCDCGATVGVIDQVYALGRLDYDFGITARYDWYVQEMSGRTYYDRETKTNNTPFGSPMNKKDMAYFVTESGTPAGGGSEILEARRSSLIWTLKVGDVPVYALQPEGAFASGLYQTLATFFFEQEIGENVWDPAQAVFVFEKASRVSIPGYIVGTTTLMNGQTVPVVAPSTRGLYNWNTHKLIAEAIQPYSADTNKQDKLESLLRQLFEKLYYQLRNLGRSPRDRVLNMAGTNVYEVVQFWAGLPDNDERYDALSGAMLQDLRAEPSQVSPPGRDFWDLVITMFNPDEALTKAKTVTRVTIDVSDVVPVLVGDPRSWPTY